jgi:hypothetical protein
MSYRIVRSCFDWQENVIRMIDLHFTCQERILQAIDWNDFFIYWDVDGSYEIVRLSSVVLIASLNSVLSSDT